MKPIANYFSFVFYTFISLFIVQAVYAERPQIKHINTDERKEWKTLCSDLKKSASKLSELLADTKIVYGSEKLDLLLLAVIMSPGNPISKYGADITELAFIRIQGMNSEGGEEDWIAVLTRSPYSINRTWRFESMISEVHYEPMISGFVSVESKYPPGSVLINYLKLVFTPDACISSLSFLTDVMLFDSALIALCGKLPSDEEIRKVMAQQ